MRTMNLNLELAVADIDRKHRRGTDDVQAVIRNTTNRKLCVYDELTETLWTIAPLDYCGIDDSADDRSFYERLFRKLKKGGCLRKPKADYTLGFTPEDKHWLDEARKEENCPW